MAEDTGPVARFIERLTSPFRRKSTPEPIMPLWKAGIQEPVLVQGVSIPALYATVQESIILRTTINTLCQEIFRRGHYWKKKFQFKCSQCEEEYQHEVKECHMCGGTDFDTPNADEILYPRWFIKQRNGMDQSFTDVLREVEWDMDIVDDGFIVLLKEYYINKESNEIELFRVKELVRGDPTFMRIVADKRGVRGGRYLICPVHRDKTQPFIGDEKKCEVCNLELQDVHFINTAGSGKTQYYIEGEVVHISKYQPSKLYGRSPVATMWRQAMTLSAMDNYMYLAYQKRRIPRGVLAITTDNIQSTASFWKGAEEKMERDPNYIPKVGIESATGRGRVEFVRFMDTLDEMQYGPVRDELRMRIAAFYGVSNIFMMDSGKGGGLNNEGMQILVTNRAVEFGQKLYSRDIFPRIFEEMGVNDWEMTLHPNEEEDEVTRLRRDEMEVNIAQRMAQLGFQPELTEDAGRDIRFFYKQPEPQQQMGAAPQGQGSAPPSAPPEGAGPPPTAAPPPMMPPASGMPGAMPPRRGGAPAIPPSSMPHQNQAAAGGPPPMIPGADRAMRAQTVAGQPPRMRSRGNEIMTMEKSGAVGLGEGTGTRDRGPAPVSSETQLSGSPKSKKNQRGPKKTITEQALDAVRDAQETAADPLNNKKDSNLPG